MTLRLFLSSRISPLSPEETQVNSPQVILPAPQSDFALEDLIIVLQGAEDHPADGEEGPSKQP